MEERKVENMFLRLQDAMRRCEEHRPCTEHGSHHLETFPPSINCRDLLAADETGAESHLHVLYDGISKLTIFNQMHVFCIQVLVQGILGGIGVQQLLTNSCISRTKSNDLQSEVSSSLTLYCIIVAISVRLGFLLGKSDSNKSPRNRTFAYKIRRFNTVISLLTLFICIQTVGAEMRYYKDEGSDVLRPNDTQKYIMERFIVIKSSLLILCWILFCISEL